MTSILTRFGVGVAMSLFVSIGGAAESGELVATLTLDSLSFISFGNREVIAIPPGSTLKFRFGAPNLDGSISFRVSPDDVDIAPMGLQSEGGRIRYRLAETSRGTLRVGSDGRLIMELTSAVEVTLDDDYGGGGKHTYPLRFSTEHAEAKSVDRRNVLAVDGMRIQPGANHVQLVAGTTNSERSIVEPGAATYAVLSGAFDRLPIIP